MILVELFSKADCHLCDVAKESLRRIQTTHPFDLKVTVLNDGDTKYEECKERFPVILVNGAFAFQYTVPEKAFIQKLKSLVAQQ